MWVKLLSLIGWLWNRKLTVRTASLELCASLIGKPFEELMDMFRINAMAAGNATNPIIFEPMVMSILVGHQKKLRKLEHNLTVSDKLIDESSCANLIRNLNFK